ncbi:MAG: tripartite tricarboxylate transporter substrate binding protein [Burkholderiaceae bacterium]|nr:tripartite tricarboxylate transporter substrate binding protein [Burkholderiaceae bacterium]
MRAHRWIQAVTLFAAAALAAFTAAADSFPSKPIRILVAYAAGGATDSLARHLSVPAGEMLGQSVVVDNKPGGATVIAAQALIQSAPDGYTMAFFDPSTVAMNQYLFKKPPYDPAKAIAPVTMLTKIPFGIMVRTDHPVKSLGEFVAQVKAKTAVTYGHSGAGNPVHLAMERFLAQAGLQMTHVPYRGGAPALADLIGGQVGYLMMDIPSAMPFIKDGKVRVLAVTSAKRTDMLPDVPTIAELGYAGYEASSWFGAFVPAGTPPDVIAKLNKTLRDAVAKPDVTAWIKGRTLEPATSTPGELAAVIKSDEVKYAQIIKQLNFSLD